MEHLSTLLPKTLRKHGLKDESDAALLVLAANRWLKQFFPNPDVARAIRFVNKELTITVENSIAAQELHALSDELIAHLQEQYPLAPLERIRGMRTR